MRFNFSAIALLTLLGPSVLTAASGLTAADVTVGKNLQMYASVKVAGGAPQEGLKLTLTSDDPSRLLISRAPDQAGSATIDLMVQPRFPEGPEFWLQALADHGTVTEGQVIKHVFKFANKGDAVLEILKVEPS